MKIRRYKATQLGELSPITKGGQIVFSRLQTESDPHEPMNPWHIEYVPDAEEAVKVLIFLDDMNGIGWTPQLKKIEKELRLALLDLMTTDAKDEGSDTNSRAKTEPTES